jgi:GntR family transcriptional regulator
MEIDGRDRGVRSRRDPEAKALRPVPLWLQVRNSVFASIQEGNLPQDAKLPSESELCARFGVSRIVVREAMAQLVAARIVYRLQGKGAFVARREEPQTFVGVNRGFSEELLDQNHVVTYRILRQCVAQPSEHIRGLLQLDQNEPVICLDRVLLVDGIPRIMVETSIPQSIAPGLDQISMEGKPLYTTLQRQYGISFVKSQRWLDAKLATPALAKVLEVPPGAPLLEIESCAQIVDNRPGEYYLAYYRTDQARVSLSVK